MIMPAERDITIYDIARHLNISATTVSRGLKNNPSINKDTRKKNFDTAAELGYRSNLFASSLRSKKTHTLGVIVHNLNSYFVATVLAGMKDVVNREAITLLSPILLKALKKKLLTPVLCLIKEWTGFSFPWHMTLIK